MKMLYWLLAVIALTTHAQARYQIEEVASELSYPWSLAFLPNGGYLLSERSGHLKQLDQNGKLLASIRADLPDIFIASQGGLLDIALRPDFKESGALFLSYSCGTASANSTCLASATLTDTQLSSVKQIFRARPDRAGAAHYGGRLALLPDNTLVLTLGDGFVYREQAQNPANHIGKLVRLNFDGSIPADNPFVGNTAYAAEIYSLGHRNVQGIVYDNLNNSLFIHEHGPRGGDELNNIVAGGNYGWPIATHGIDYTGARVSPFTTYPGLVEPLYHWTPSIAPAGITLYRGNLFPQWQGNIFIAALAAKRLHRLVMDGDKVVEEEVMLNEVNTRLRDVRTGPNGALYILTDSDKGKLLRIIPAR